MRCYACEMTAQGEAASVRERVYVDAHWRVAHAFDTSLPGWLVVVSKRHVESLDALTHEEAAALGPLLRRLTSALKDVTGAVKTYIALFAEGAGFRHLHVHVVPRMADMPAGAIGPGVFSLLGAPPEGRIGEARRDEIARAVQASLAAEAVERDR